MHGLAKFCCMHVQTLQTNDWIRRRWDNNNAESINNLLKVTADWKQLPTTSVMDNVHDVVRVQYGAHSMHTATSPWRPPSRLIT